jgi:hypothetical protein
LSIIDARIGHEVFVLLALLLLCLAALLLAQDASVKGRDVLVVLLV